MHAFERGKGQSWRGPDHLDRGPGPNPDPDMIYWGIQSGSSPRAYINVGVTVGRKSV